jgi:hypothetical protein
MDYGLLHVTTNSILEVLNSSFTENFSIGRGVIIYSDSPHSISIVRNSNFTNNSGIYGGVFSTELRAMIDVDNCTFTNNFAIQGGVLYLSNDGKFSLKNSNI